MRRFTIMAKVSKDIELKQSKSGKNYIRFGVFEKKWNAQEGESPYEYMDIMAFETVAEKIAKNFKKGDPIYLEGNFAPNKYTNKDGVEINTFQFTAYMSDFVPRASNGGGKGNYQKSYNKPKPQQNSTFQADMESGLGDDSDDSLPF